MINVTVTNADVRDLFVTVVDTHVAVDAVVLNAARFNRGASRVVAIQEGGDGRGHVRWQVNIAEEPNTIKTGEAERLGDGDTVSVSS
jgi:hypothetical protein